MNELLESYLNGNLTYARQQLKNADFTLAAFFAYYLDQCDPDKDDMKLFIYRLTD